jgi:transcriptional regulator with XRE-family HTH domain
MSVTARRMGQIIRAHRERRGLSQEALAELAHLNRNYLGAIERGDSVPSLETLQKVADALNEKLSVLVAQSEGLNNE